MLYYRRTSYSNANWFTVRVQRTWQKSETTALRFIMSLISKESQHAFVMFPPIYQYKTFEVCLICLQLKLYHMPLKYPSMYSKVASNYDEHNYKQ